MDERRAEWVGERAEGLSAVVVDAGLRIHRELGPGLLESVYEAVLARMLAREGLLVERQKSVPFDYDGMHFDEGLRLGLLVDGALVVELKSVAALLPVHSKQVFTYLRLLDLPLGLLINFGGETFKGNCRRVVNRHTVLASSRLRINQDHIAREGAKARRKEGE